MKKITALLMSATLFISTLGISVSNINITTVQAANTWPSQPDVVAETACLIEASTGAVLFDKKSHKKMYPASITKILTALVTLDNCKLDEKVTFSQSAIDCLSYDDANMEMVAGEVLSVEDCLYGLMLQSANEVAAALGEHVAGSKEKFAQMMNERAKKAGAKDSNFMNANGLHEKKHYVTAYDMAMITRAAVANPVFLSITGSTEYTISASNKKKARTIYQRHKMVNPYSGYYYDGILGGKTGYTDQSGTTLVSYAKRDGMTLICVVLNSSGINSYEDTTKLFDYGFKNFHLVNVSDNDKRFSEDSENYTNYLTPLFGSSDNKSLKIKNDDCIVLPKKAKFSQVTSTVTFNSSDSSGSSASSYNGSVAKINYKFEDHSVGWGTVIYTGNDASTAKANTTSVKTTAQASEDIAVNNNNSEQTSSASDKNNKSENENTNKDTNKNTKGATKDTSKQTTGQNSSTSHLLRNIVFTLVGILIIIAIVLFARKKQRQLNEIRARKRHRSRNR